jgi:hypothetical protein
MRERASFTCLGEYGPDLEEGEEHQFDDGGEPVGDGMAGLGGADIAEGDGGE